MTRYSWTDATITFGPAVAPIVARVKAYEPPRALAGASAVPAPVTVEAVGTFDDGADARATLAALCGADRPPAYDVRSTYADGREVVQRMAIEEGAADIGSGRAWWQMTPFHGPRREDGTW